MMPGGPFPYVTVELEGARVYLWHRRDDPPKASLRPLATWALVIFLAGALAGSACTFLAQRPAFGAEGSTVSLPPVEPSAARAAHTRLFDGLPSTMADEARELSEPARATLPHHAEDVLSAASVTQREDPPTAVRVNELRVVLSAIHRAAIEFGQHPGRMVGVAYCESSFDPTEVGDAGERGIFQFTEDTWTENAPALGYGPDDITDVVASSRVAAEMWSRGMQARWSCWR